MDDLRDKPSGAGASGAAEATARDVSKTIAKVDRKVEEALQRIDKVFVAVHGIGDQFQFETIQLVAHRLGKFFDVPAPIPLGSFHSERAQEAGFLFLEHPPYPERFQDIGLAEIYWADIPRAIQKEGHTLEESKKWAATLVDRVRMRARGGAHAPGADDYQMLEQVIGEMIEGVAVLDRLLFLVGKMTPFKFQLKDLLDSFLGDVQIVTDFQVQRVKLMGQFRQIMDRIHKANPGVKIYIVAHSEGTVVSLLGLLEAFKGYAAASGGEAERFGWIGQVKGLMTIGSPIEEHMLLWPELWDEFEVKAQGPGFAGWPTFAERIKWRNYFDHGDPIAYRLGGPPERPATTSKWLRENGWGAVFEFENFHPDDDNRHEIGFSRYPFPGKAHLDYWEDKEVFGHFLETVVGLDTTPPGEAAGPAAGDPHPFRKPPRSKRWVEGFSRVVPYVLPAALIVTAVTLFFQAVRGFLAPDAAKVDSLEYMWGNVAGIAMLLMGITLMSRVPRLTRSFWARLGAGLIFLASAAIFPLLVDKGIRGWLGGRLGRLLFSGLPRAFGLDAWPGFGPYDQSTLGLLIIATLLVVAVALLSDRYPKLGAKTLIVPGFLTVVVIVGVGMARAWYHNATDRGSLWPVLLSGAALLYCWWLAVVLFDLIYVWHHYIRGSARGATMADRLRVIVKDPSTDT